jgi:hypothetical protein
MPPNPVLGPPMEPAGPGKTVVIVQSNYLPWRGYFDLMRRADEFILLDTVRRRGFLANP